MKHYMCYLIFREEGKTGRGAFEYPTLFLGQIDPEKVHWEQTLFPVNNDQGNQSTCRGILPLGQSDPVICQVCGKLIKIRVSGVPSDPELHEYDPNGPFSGSH